MMITVTETGAKTLAEARPMQIDGQFVYVQVGDGTASLNVGGRIVAEKDADEMSCLEAQTWAAEYRTSMNDGEIPLAVAAVRAQSEYLITKAEAAEAHGEGDYKYRSELSGRWVTFHNQDPRHPSRAAKSYRRDAQILAAWTVADESNYGQYVSQGIGDTDGHYAPLGRAAWKATIGA